VPGLLHCKQVGAAALSQVAASSATYPHEVLRSHMHVEGTASPAGMAAHVRQVGPCGCRKSRRISAQKASSLAA
jgi:hypothetical protein